jgi:hypothetical protein
MISTHATTTNRDDSTIQPRWLCPHVALKNFVGVRRSLRGRHILIADVSKTLFILILVLAFILSRPRSGKIARPLVRIAAGCGRLVRPILISW